MDKISKSLPACLREWTVDQRVVWQGCCHLHLLEQELELEQGLEQEQELGQVQELELVMEKDFQELLLHIITIKS